MGSWISLTVSLIETIKLCARVNGDRLGVLFDKAELWMCTFKDITDAMFFLACGNLPVKTDCVCFHRYVQSLVTIIPTILQIGIFFNLIRFVAALELKCDHAQFFFWEEEECKITGYVKTPTEFLFGCLLNEAAECLTEMI